MIKRLPLGDSIELRVHSQVQSREKVKTVDEVSKKQSGMEEVSKIQSNKIKKEKAGLKIVRKKQSRVEIVGKKQSRVKFVGKKQSGLDEIRKISKTILTAFCFSTMRQQPSERFVYMSLRCDAGRFFGDKCVNKLIIMVVTPSISHHDSYRHHVSSSMTRELGSE